MATGSKVWEGGGFSSANTRLSGERPSPAPRLRRVGISLGKSFEISPEVIATVDDSFDFNLVWLYPGVMLNFKAGNFFVGAGAVLPVLFGEGESDTGNPAPKINVGYKCGKFMITVYAMTWTESGLDFLDMNFIGATLGYKF
jgi:hypothetical protein